jgi:integrase
VSTNRYANRFEISCPARFRRAIVRLVMLTGQRREEMAGKTWTELSEDLATWTIPATRTKNGIPHLVPLSQPASKILQALRSDGPRDVQGAHQRAKLALVFPGERGTPFSGWSKAKSALDTASGVSGWWLHDLRRTLATIAHAMTISNFRRLASLSIESRPGRPFRPLAPEMPASL